jgi:molybdopterin-guanine dinucleotide biosynthesis protein A
MTHGAIILCGGHSVRMGLPKLALPFGTETMLARIVRLLGSVCEPIVVVAARSEQRLPPLPVPVILAQDRQAGRGPLEGIAAGLAALPESVRAAYITGCDVPLLVPAVVTRMFDLLGDEAAAVPVSGGFLHPLSAVYSRSVLDVVEEFLATDRLRPGLLFDCVATRRVSEAELRDVDPALDTLKNLNHPADYLAALAQAGFTAPPEILEQLAMGTTE